MNFRPLLAAFARWVEGDGRLRIEAYGYFTDLDRVVRGLSSTVNDLNGGAPLPLKAYAKANLPTAANHEGSLVYVTDETGGKTVAFSDGSSWRRVQDRNVVS